jgi:biopolymer transport protein ExbD
MFFMPVKLTTTRLTEGAEARIEIIPLIDIMFFLLASFMLVSLSMVNLKSVKLNLPTATTATPETTKSFVDISVNKAGSVFLDKKPVDDQDLIVRLAAQRQRDANVRVLVSGDRETMHGDIIHVLDLVRLAGIDRVAFEVSQGAAAPGGGPKEPSGTAGAGHVERP